MKRTERHQDSITRKVLQFIKTKELVKSGQHVIVAVSGGIDSMVLLDILIKLRGILKIKLTVAHMNFGLRGRSSDSDEQFVKLRAKKYKVSCFTKKVETKQYIIENRASTQEAARDLRYEFFDNLKKSLKADIVATAHNTDDNAETMLFNFFRGSGLQGLTGIPIQRGYISRPLLCLPRIDIARYAKQNGISYRTDESNRETEYNRNFIRRSVIPKIEKRINPSLKSTLQKKSEIFSSLAEFVTAETEKYFRMCVSASSISLSKFRNVHPFLQQSIVKKLLESLNIEPAFPIIRSIVDAKDLQKGSVITINDSLIAERLSTAIVIHSKKQTGNFDYIVSLGQSVRHDTFTFSIEKGRKQNIRSGDSSFEYVDAQHILFPLTVRSWKRGDWFIPLGMKGRKKLSDFFGEQKLSTKQKSEVPIVLSGNTIIWVGGFRLDDRCKITDATQSIYKLMLTIHGKKNDHRK